PSAARGRGTPGAVHVVIRLGYRPPLDWAGMLAFLGERAIPGVEEVAGGVYRRAVAVADATGVVEVAPDPARPVLLARVPVALARGLGAIAARLRALFDLDARPDAITAALAG